MQEIFMHRCFQLAKLGSGQVSPNPLVGAVLVFENKIIGEGWHQKYGEAHAEVNAIHSVLPENQELISKSTLYCSLEPCFHFGKTPPCVNLVLAQKIPRVVLSNTDPNPKTGGQSIAKMRAAGIEVITGVLEKEGTYLNRAFFTNILKKRPYIIIKWAQSADGFIAKTGERTPISMAVTQRLVHRWRAESDAILVGTNTAITDNPRLDTRFYINIPKQRSGNTPLRIFLDFDAKIPKTHHTFDGSQATWIITNYKLRITNYEFGITPKFIELPKGDLLIPALLKAIWADKKAILLVEGGADLHRQFIEKGLWDEIRVIENERLLGDGVPAALLPEGAFLQKTVRFGGDLIKYWVGSRELTGFLENR